MFIVIVCILSFIFGMGIQCWFYVIPIPKKRLRYKIRYKIFKSARYERQKAYIQKLIDNNQNGVNDEEIKYLQENIHIFFHVAG